MGVTTYQADNEKWNEIIKSFNDWDVHYLSQYVKAFEMAGNGEPVLFFYEDDSCRAAHVIMKRSINKDLHISSDIELFDVISPYGYAGWLIEGDKNRVYPEYRNWCKENNIVSEFIRFNLFNDNITSYYGTITQRTNNAVRSLDIPYEQVMTEVEHKVRKNYKKAVNNELKIIIDPAGEYLDDFLQIYYSTMKRDNAEDKFMFPKSFFEQLQEIDNGCMYFHTALYGKVISTELVLMGLKNMYSFLGGTDSNYFEYRPNDFLKCEIIKWGIDHNYKRFILGGGYGADDGIFRYKKSFAPNGIIPFYTGEAVFMQEEYEKLCSIRKSNPDSSFFPLYRS